MPRRSNIIYQQPIVSEHLQPEQFVDSAAIISHSSVYALNVERDRTNMRQDHDVESRESYMDSLVLDKIRAEPMDMSESLMQVPINGKKTSRRKQSKPIRVSFIDVDALDSELTSVPQSNTQTEPMEGIEGNRDNAVVNDDPGQQQQQPQQQPQPQQSGKISERQEEIGCDMCGDTFATELDLKQHITTEHLSKACPEDKYSFPTKYHRLGNEFQQATALKQEVTETEAVASNEPPVSAPSYLPPSYESSTAVSSQESGVDHLTKSSRIFHPDAYCEICDREFCNKYFLKTHKANKHGIYDSSSSYSAAFPAVSAAQDQNSRISSSPEQMNTGLPPNIGSHEQMQTPPKQAEVQSAMQTLIESKTSLNQITNPTAPPPPTDAEDYCEICQKHFCNKYYLKKHKQDVHGIGLSDQFKRQRLMQPENHILSSLSSSIASTCTPPTASLIIPQPHFTTATNNSTANNLANIATVNSMGNIMLLNPFVPPMAILQAQSLIPAHSQPMNPTSVHNLTSLATTGHAQSLPSDNSTALSLVQQPEALKPTNLSQSPSNLVVDKSKTTQSTASDTTTNTPKNLTINSLLNESVSAEASTEVRCDMCSKEFYNVFFLRIHKANKHGVHMDEMPKKSKGSSQGGDSDRASPENESYRKMKLEAEAAAMSDGGILEPGEKERSSGDGEDFCTMCNKEFASKYSLKIHMINVHAVKPTDLSAFSAVVPNESPITNHDSSEVESEKEKAVLATMFGSIVAAKMADRVTCDICQKEVCNKYFLKTHKMKVHGIAPTPDKDGNSNGSSENLPFKSEVAIKPENIEKPPEAELLKMGIDPEAYCEICKKEFCSKYFLKTHKLNIHGIKDKKDTSSASLLMSKINKKELSQIFTSNLNMVSSAQLANVDTNPISQLAPSAIPTSLPPVSVTGTPQSKIDKLAPIMPFVPSPQMVPSGLRIESLNSAEKRHWKWKEPVNATRVSCDICNKELCNKYFLRTHKLNKHGIVDDSSSPLKIPNFHGSSSSASSTTSEKADHGMDDRLDQFNTSLGMKLNVVREARGESEESSMADKGHSSCLLCSKQFQDERELGLHILTEHKLKSEDGQESSENRTEKDSQAGLKCGLCGSVFIDTMSLQLHLIHDHQGRVAISESPQKIGTSAFSTISTIGMSLKKRYAKNGKPKLHSCSQCDYKSRWLSNIYSHEDRKHRGVDGPQKQHTCTECSRVFRYNHSLVRHLQEHHGHFIGNSDVSDSTMAQGRELDNNIIATQFRMRQKNFKCARCGIRFSSRLQCQTHIRLAHRIRKEDAVQSDIVSPSSGCNLQCTICPFACKSTLALRAHMAIKHQRKLRHIPQNANLVNGDESEKDVGTEQINEDVEMSPEVVTTATPSSDDMQNFIMQPFTIKDMSPEKMLVTSMVRLPVLQKITEPINITISLKPTDN